VWFSGAKGFSVFIYDKSVTDSHGATDVPERVKNTCSRMAEGIATFDPTPYDRCRIWRVQNTINSKTGLYKIPLTINEIMSWNIDTIKECAKNQRSF
jgi:hypothetical protein